MSVPVARWVAAMAIGGLGLAGMGYSLATRATPAPPPVVFVPRTLTPTTQTPTTQAPTTQTPAIQTPATQAPAPQQTATASDSPGAPPPSEPAQKLEAGRTLDVNTATAEQLQLLPGIGPSRAAAIIADRERNGPYRTVEDLARVRGIGPVTVENLRPYVRIGPP